MGGGDGGLYDNRREPLNISHFRREVSWAWWGVSLRWSCEESLLSVHVLCGGMYPRLQMRSPVERWFQRPELMSWSLHSWILSDPFDNSEHGTNTLRIGARERDVAIDRS